MYCSHADKIRKEVIVRKHIKVALSVFLVAFAFGLNITGISPVLGIMSEKYAEYGTSMIQLLQTLPYLLLMVGSYVIGLLTTKITKKRIILYGLIIIGVCGAIPFLTENFIVLLASRVLIGFGFGIVSPMNTAVIAELIPAEERAGFMGLHVVGMGVGNMAGNLIGGLLAGIGYRNYYLVYLIAFIAAAGVWLLLLETPAAKAEKALQMKLNKKVYYISLASFLHTLFINAYNTNLGIYIIEQISKEASLPGMAMAVNAAAALVVGMFFAQISKLLKKYTMAFSILAASAGYLVILLVPGMAGVFAASMLCGISLSCFMASASYQISLSVEPDAVAKASGVFSIIGGIGGLIAPIVLGNCAGIILGNNSAQNQFLIALAGMTVFGLVVLCSALRKEGER